MYDSYMIQNSSYPVHKMAFTEKYIAVFNSDTSLRERFLWLQLWDIIEFRRDCVFGPLEIQNLKFTGRTISLLREIYPLRTTSLIHLYYMDPLPPTQSKALFVFDRRLKTSFASCIKISPSLRIVAYRCRYFHNSVNLF